MKALDSIYQNSSVCSGCAITRKPRLKTQTVILAVLELCNFQGTFRGATRPNAFPADGVPRNPHRTPSWRPWVVFVRLLHLLLERYYPETSSQTVILAVLTYCSFQGTFRGATRPNAFPADGTLQNPHPTSSWRPWMVFVGLFRLFWVCYYSETSSPTVILAVLTLCSFQGTFRGATRPNAFTADETLRNPHPT